MISRTTELWRARLPLMPISVKNFFCPYLFVAFNILFCPIIYHGDGRQFSIYQLPERLMCGMYQIGIAVFFRMERYKEAMGQPFLQSFGTTIRPPFISFYLLYLLGKRLKSLFNFFYLVGGNGRVESEQDYVAKYFLRLVPCFATGKRERAYQ